MTNDELEQQIRSFSERAEGWTRADKAIRMADLILQEKPLLCVEIGVFAGGSLIPQALALKSLGRGIIIGVDAWESWTAAEGESEANRDWWIRNSQLERMLSLTSEAIFQHGLEPHALLVRGRSEYAAQALPVELDILNIDGNHSEEASVRDVELWLPKVKAGGYIWFDDTDWRKEDGTGGTQKAVQMLDNSCAIVEQIDKSALYRKPLK